MPPNLQTTHGDKVLALSKQERGSMKDKMQSQSTLTQTKGCYIKRKKINKLKMKGVAALQLHEVHHLLC